VSDITNRNLAASMQLMAWERAKGELRGLLHTYWAVYSVEGKMLDDGFQLVSQKISGFIKDLDDLLT
jgi:hypothetical protein